ncbi:DUF6519 domain-containing protein [Microcoleus sp.]|uniref:DUF6519 domain-containing protein n=1 Tax=Microcoleus sp. TaxID=44472 RepID=UPI00403E60E9
MKGDFTRSTFQPEKHYTSVRMQQGRLQLDSDWNEQVDIEAYLRHAQSVDMIGADSGVPTSGGDSGEPYRDSFKISITPDGSDLAIAPGRLYANGTFCELEATPFVGTFTASNRIQVNTLIVDGRQIEKYQWIEIAPDNNPGLKTSVQIADVNNQTLEITLNFNSGEIKKSIEQIQQESPQVQLHRVITYNTQPDYIKPEEPLKQDTIYLAYVDVWQRHITAIEDPNIREVALNTPDTTTRTKTVWQIKLKKIDELIKEVAGDSQAVEQLQKYKNLNNLNAPDCESLMQQVWAKFLIKQEQRQALMNACAKLCSSSVSQSNRIGYQRLENLLYRVEIYEPSQVEQGENQGNNGTNKATFKWSRDNGSIVSSIEKVEGNVITIRKSSQDAWMSSRTGQWLEITNEEMELKGQPGVMVPLSRALDSKIEFNESRIVNGPIPNNSTKVRLWSHEVKNAPNGVIPIADDWLELEIGIKVRFYKDSVYRTGDYWLIPARSATNDIEWAHNQAELQRRQPLPQPPKGIHHDYCSLALIQFDGQLKGEEEKAEQEEQESKNIRDLRIIFPPLMRCLDKAGGIITGALEIKSDLYLGGTLKLTNNDQTAAVSFQIDKKNSENWLQFTAPKLTGYSFDQQIKAQQGVVTNRIDINGTAKAIQLEGNSLKLKDLTVGQFSNNSNLTDNEQSVPTEKAVKAYVDEEITDVKATLANKADSTDVKKQQTEIAILAKKVKALEKQNTEIAILTEKVKALETPKNQ